MNCLRLKAEVSGSKQEGFSRNSFGLKRIGVYFFQIWLKPSAQAANLRLKPEAIHKKGAVSKSFVALTKTSSQNPTATPSAFPASIYYWQINRRTFAVGYDRTYESPGNILYSFVRVNFAHGFINNKEDKCQQNIKR